MFAVLREKAAGYALGERLAAEFGENLWCYLCETIPGAPPSEPVGETH